MQEQFKALTFSYKNTPLQIREQIALSEEECKRLLVKIQEFTGVNELMIVSTCNRTEFYYSAAESHTHTILGLLALEKQTLSANALAEYVLDLSENLDAVRHLVYVSLGLESQVIGDLQVTGQVKKAYQWAADANLAGPFLHRLMHSIFFTNKRVIQETPFRDGAASVSYAAVELLGELLQHKPNPAILVVGVGEMGADVVRNLRGAGYENVKVTNRTYERAQALAEECGYEPLRFEQLFAELPKADAVVSSVGLEKPLFTRASLSVFPIYTHKIFLDLAVPRGVAADAEEVPGVLVYNVDSIHNRASAALEARKNAIPQVRAIADQTIEEFSDWSREMIFSPTIQKLKNALETIRQEEMTRYMREMTPQEAEKVDLVTRNIMQKIIRLPVLQLKAACKRGEAETLVDVLNDLFNLEKQPEQV